MAERIQKVLARAGAGSRRQIEAWIREGRIAVNGATAIVGSQISPRDRVTLDGRPLRVREPDSDTRVILYHRSPRRALGEGETDEGLDLDARLPKRAGRRWIPISPLPPNDGGLEVLTSDGELAQALMRTLSTLRIEFALRVRGEPTLGQLEHLKSGVIEDAAPLQIESVIPAGGEGFNRWIHLVTRGARARDVHRLCAAAGLQMSRIMRVSLGPLQMDRALARERTRPLSLRETEELYGLVGMTPAREAPVPHRPRFAHDRSSNSGRRPSRPVERAASANDERRPRSRDAARDARRSFSRGAERRPVESQRDRPRDRSAGPRPNAVRGATNGAARGGRSGASRRPGGSSRSDGTSRSGASTRPRDSSRPSRSSRPGPSTRSSAPRGAVSTRAGTSRGKAHGTGKPSRSRGGRPPSRR